MNEDEEKIVLQQDAYKQLSLGEKGDPVEIGLQCVRNFMGSKY